MIVTMAVITTLAMPPMLRAALARCRWARRRRSALEREEFEQRGFVANLERLLLAVDESVNGQFAARLAGLIAGAQGMPIPPCVPSAKRPKEPQKGRRRGKKAAEARWLKQAAESTTQAEPIPEKVHITDARRDGARAKPSATKRARAST